MALSSHVMYTVNREILNANCGTSKNISHNHIGVSNNFKFRLESTFQLVHMASLANEVYA